MPAMPVPVAGERRSLLEFLVHQQTAYRALVLGLTDEQARSRPTCSAMSLGGLVKHQTVSQYAWTQRVVAGSEMYPDDPGSLVGMLADLGAQHEMRADDTLAALVEAFTAQSSETYRVFAEADLAAPIYVPAHIDGLYSGGREWTVRWALLHVIEELARHAGQADIIRESIDGATMYVLLAKLEGW